MEFEISMRIKLDADSFYWNDGVVERVEAVTEMLRDAMYDLDEVSIKTLEVEQLV